MFYWIRFSAKSGILSFTTFGVNF